jgi:hypothetical protein
MRRNLLYGNRMGLGKKNGERCGAEFCYGESSVVGNALIMAGYELCEPFWDKRHERELSFWEYNGTWQK